MSIEISIITPCFNEESSVQECAAAVKKVMQSALPGVTYEHIFSDNASTDNTMEQLRILAASDKRIIVVSNSRNIGPFRNIYRAMSKASGKTIVPMLPADLQDPAEVIPAFYSEWLKGNLVVFGERKNREESIILRMLRAKGADLSNSKIAGKFDGYSEAWSKSTFEVGSIKELMRLTEEFEMNNPR